MKMRVDCECLLILICIYYHVFVSLPLDVTQGSHQNGKLGKIWKYKVVRKFMGNLFSLENRGTFFKVLIIMKMPSFSYENNSNYHLF
jgi:hypothetical protein